MRKSFLCHLLMTVTVTTLAAGSNLIQEGDFETLRPDKMPNGPAWAWRNNGSKQLQIELSSTEKHSGNSSLHLIDADCGNSNDGLIWMMAGNELPRWGGKMLRLSCQIKQIRASCAKSVGIGYWIKRKDGKSDSGFAGPESTEETVWTEYNLPITVPADAELLFVFLHCANGWGNDAEAFFDDLTLIPMETTTTTVTNGSPSPLITSIVNEKAFYFFHDRLLPLWEKRNWGGLYLEQQDSSGQNNAKLKCATVKGSQPYAGIGLFCPFANRMASLSAAAPAATFFFMVKPFFPMQIQIADKTVPVTDEMKISGDNGWTMIKIPLTAFYGNLKFGVVDAVNFQFTVPLPAGSSILFDEIGITGLAGQVDLNAVDPVVRDRAKRLCQGLDRVWTTDQYQRPEIRNGTFYLHGKPVFMLGPWVDDISLKADFGPGSTRECMRGTIYDQMFGSSVAAELGMNSLQLSAAARYPYLRKLNFPWGKRQLEDAEALAQMFRGLNGMPFIQDYAWINGIAGMLKAENPASDELMQKNPGWHEFIPLCPEHPRAIEIYSAYFRTGATFALANGANPFIYEIFNESSYRCSCKFNRENFARQMEEKFKDINTANQQWKTTFNSFAELARLPNFETYPAIWAEWCKFLAQRYATILRDFGREIRKVDQRPNVYLTEQLWVSSILGSNGAGMDYRLIAKELDVLTTEGGWHFGRVKSGASNPMEEAMMSCGYSFVADFFASLSHGVKPVNNDEHYCTSSLFGKRVPSKKEDLLTAMWSEVFHGLSGSFPYAWCKRVWEWKDFAEAKAMVYNGGYKASHMLNPYSWPRQELDGFKQFSEEVNRLAEIVLPQPRRVPAKVALIYSYPSLRMSAINHENVEKQLLNCYFALLYSQYPPEIVFAEEMTADNLRRFDAVVLPAIRNADRTTIAALHDYAKAGGLVVCAGNALTENEYAQPLDASALLGLRRDKDKVLANTATTSGQGWHHILGNGHVYYLEKSFDNPETAGTIPEILKTRQTGRYFTLQPLDGKPLVQAELQLIDRGDVKLLLLINWEDCGSRLVRLQYAGKEQLPAMYLSSPTKRELYLSGCDKQWTEKSLRNGVTVLLPPQTRVLLLFSTVSPADTDQPVDTEQVNGQFKAVLAAETGELVAVNRQEAELTVEDAKARNFSGVKTASCVPLDLRRQANASFSDELPGDKRGGWFDQGVNDYRQMPLGLVRLAGDIPFKIIDPATNNDHSAIVLRGIERPYFAKSVNDIEVGMKVTHLYVLHTAGWEQKPGEPCYYLKVNYADDTMAMVPVPFEEAIGGWWNPKPIPDAKIAHESANSVCQQIGLYCWRWTNPHPDKMIKTLDFESGKDNAVPAIVAITAEK